MSSVTEDSDAFFGLRAGPQAVFRSKMRHLPSVTLDQLLELLLRFGAPTGNGIQYILGSQEQFPVRALCSAFDFIFLRRYQSLGDLIPTIDLDSSLPSSKASSVQSEDASKSDPFWLPYLKFLSTRGSAAYSQLASQMTFLPASYYSDSGQSVRSLSVAKSRVVSKVVRYHDAVPPFPTVVTCSASFLPAELRSVSNPLDPLVIAARLGASLSGLPRNFLLSTAGWGLLPSDGWTRTPSAALAVQLTTPMSTSRQIRTKVLSLLDLLKKESLVSYSAVGFNAAAIGVKDQAEGVTRLIDLFQLSCRAAPPTVVFNLAALSANLFVLSCYCASVAVSTKQERSLLRNPFFRNQVFITVNLLLAVSVGYSIGKLHGDIQVFLGSFNDSFAREDPAALISFLKIEGIQKYWRPRLPMLELLSRLFLPDQPRVPRCHVVRDGQVFGVETLVNFNADPLVATIFNECLAALRNWIALDEKKNFSWGYLVSNDQSIAIVQEMALYDALFKGFAGSMLSYVFLNCLPSSYEGRIDYKSMPSFLALRHKQGTDIFEAYSREQSEVLASIHGSVIEMNHSLDDVYHDSSRFLRLTSESFETIIVNAKPDVISRELQRRMWTKIDPDYISKAPYAVWCSWFDRPTFTDLQGDANPYCSFALGPPLLNRDLALSTNEDVRCKAFLKGAGPFLESLAPCIADLVIVRRIVVLNSGTDRAFSGTLRQARGPSGLYFAENDENRSLALKGSVPISSSRVAEPCLFVEAGQVRFGVDVDDVEAHDALMIALRLPQYSEHVAAVLLWRYIHRMASSRDEEDVARAGLESTSERLVRLMPRDAHACTQIPIILDFLSKFGFFGASSECGHPLAECFGSIESIVMKLCVSTEQQSLESLFDERFNENLQASGFNPTSPVLQRGALVLNRTTARVLDPDHPLGGILAFGVPCVSFVSPADACVADIRHCLEALSNNGIAAVHCCPNGGSTEPWKLIPSAKLLQSDIRVFSPRGLDVFSSTHASLACHPTIATSYSTYTRYDSEACNNPFPVYRSGPLTQGDSFFTMELNAGTSPSPTINLPVTSSLEGAEDATERFIDFNLREIDGNQMTLFWHVPCFRPQQKANPRVEFNSIKVT